MRSAARGMAYIHFVKVKQGLRCALELDGLYVLARGVNFRQIAQMVMELCGRLGDEVDQAAW